MREKNPLEQDVKFPDLVAMLRSQAERQPNALLYNFLLDGESQSQLLSYGELDRAARKIGAELQARGLENERALLLYPPGLDYIAGFFGCQYAGVVAVPAYPPDPNRLERTLPRLQSIVQDSQAKVILTTAFIHSMAQFLTAQAPEFEALEWVATDSLPEENTDKWRQPNIVPEDLSFLQYTSGSTGEPKGVMLSHGNLMTNLEIIRRGFQISPDDTGVFWLPPYHDMGLIGGIIEAMYVGGSTGLMSPLDFLQKPFRWLQAMSESKATISGGPNFAYEMCIRKISPEQKKGLNLSHWKLAFTGAEPILPETVQRFAEAFESCGFQKDIFYPCYGLAEATLMVSGSVKGQGIQVKDVPKKDFLRDQVVTESSTEQKGILQLVGCGQNFPGQSITIVRPDTFEVCQSGEVGEIWVQGPSVARGYWNKPDLSQEIFGARIRGSGEGPFLRTGDLGFLDQNELFVTGRLKDLIIIRGNNHYPQDLERTLEKCHETFRPGCSAAFSVKVGLEEKLVLVQECDRFSPDTPREEFDNIIQVIIKNIALYHELEVFGLSFLKKGSIPKTSSGKVRRHACREEYLARTLETLFEYQAAIKEPPPQSIKASGSEVTAGVEQMDPVPENIKPWLINRVSEHLGIDPKQFDPSQPLSEYGLDSKDAVNLSGEMGDWLGSRFSPTLLWKYPTVETLANYLVQQELTPEFQSAE